MKDKNFQCKYDKKEIILEGTRNAIDGLWDVPIAKRSITRDNYVEPSLHGLSPISPTTIKRAYTPRTKKRDTLISNEEANIFNHFDGIIEGNVCNYLVNCQLKKDRISAQTTHILDEHLNVILRKHETHGDLADFLHGACFSPVISTFF